MKIEALIPLAGLLRTCGYEFTTVTPATHARILGRDPRRNAQDLRDFLGWNLPCQKPAPGTALANAWEILREEGMLDRGNRARIRFSTLDSLLIAHSGYPTVEEEAVFFGPDTYRFIRFLRSEVREASHALDLGCGSGAGGLSLASRCERVTLSDVSKRALLFADANARINGWPEVASCVALSDGIPKAVVPFDLIACNPPFLLDKRGRTYRHGGGEFGEALSLRFLSEGLQALSPGGRVVMYTASAVISGRDFLKEQVYGMARALGFRLEYEEIDPDIFPEELDRSAYAPADRICAVGIVARKSA